MRCFSYVIVGGNLNNIVRFDGEIVNYNDIINEMFLIFFDLELRVLIFKNFFKYVFINFSFNFFVIIDNFKNFKSDSIYIIFKEYEVKENKLFFVFK